MKKISPIPFLLWLIAIALHPHTATAQCGCAENFETTFPEAVKEAPVVIEGQIMPGVILFGGEYDDSYKSTKIAVYKVLKGNIDAKEIELISQNISFRNGCTEGISIGVFMLYPTDIKGSPRNEIALQSKFRYKIAPRIGCNTINYNEMIFGGGDKGYSPYGIESLKDIKNKVYKVVEEIVQQPYKEIEPLPKKDFGGDLINAKSENSQAVTISTISPDTLRAGTFDTLTIRGSGFTPDWLVEFRNAEKYGETYITIPNNHYIIRPNDSNDTLYKVLVPCVELKENVNRPDDGEIIIAGTGKVALRKGNTTKKSSQTLTIPYAESTYARSDTSSIIYPVRLARNTPNGDFTFWLHNTVRGNNPVRNLVQDAVEQWRCASRVNFTIACDSTTAVPLVVDDHISTVSMVDSSMPFFGLLGDRKAGTINRIRVCNSAEQAIVTESDIIFRDFPLEPLPGGGTQTIDWYYNGYTPGAINSGHYDFYTMALHEFGHAHLLEHVTNTNALMNTFSWHGSAGVIHAFDTATVLAPAIHIATLSNDNSTNTCLNAMQFIPPAAACALPDCAFIDCDSPAYPLQVYFSLMPEACLSNPDFDDVSDAWQQMVGTNVSIWAQDQSIGNIIERTWTFSSDVGTVSHLPCDIDSDIDTCLNLFWTLPGQKQVSLTVTDANGCQITHEQNIQVIDPNCALPLGIIQIEPAQLTCDVAQSDCPDSQNGQIFISPPPSSAGDCYVFYAEYSATDPGVGIPEDYYANSAFELLPDGRRRLGCLPGGYYKITMTDEVSTCFNTTTVQVPFESDNFPLVFISQHTANLAYGGMLNGFCGGTIQIDEINGEAFDSDDYVFTWSDCIDCNVPARQHLCIGTYTVTATNRYTGCSGQQTITLQLQCGEGTGEVVGVVDVYPTIYDNTANLRLSLNYDTEVTIDVYDLYGSPIKRLIDREAKQAGEYYLQDNTTNAPNGVYIYVVKACNQTKADIGIKE